MEVALLFCCSVLKFKTFYKNYYTLKSTLEFKISFSKQKVERVIFISNTIIIWVDGNFHLTNDCSWISRKHLLYLYINCQGVYIFDSMGISRWLVKAGLPVRVIPIYFDNS